jgi:cytoskeletal protein RodZ
MTEKTVQDLGARLRARRETSGRSLRQIADTTKFGVRQLEALEAGRIHQLPGGIYRRAIVRAHAREIGLDPEATLREFLAHYPDDLPAPPQPVSNADDDCPPPATPRAPRSRLFQSVLSVVGAIAPVVGAGWYFAAAARGANPPSQSAPVVPSRSTAVWQQDVAAVSQSLPAASAKRVAMSISVSARCKLQVIADGRKLVARDLEAGERLLVDLEHEVVLAGDDAGAVHISINGRSLDLGESGTPLNVRLGLEQLQMF